MKKREIFLCESVQKAIGLLPFSRAPTLNHLNKQPKEKRQKSSAYKRPNMTKKMRTKLRERKQKNALNMYNVAHVCSIYL